MSSEKTHVLLQPVIISQLGRCEAGTPIAPDDVDGDTWNWLNDNRCVKSIADIEAEADLAVTTPVTRTSRTGTSRSKPQPKPKPTEPEPQQPGSDASEPQDTEPAQPNEPSNSEVDEGDAG
jgi:hypothetical protein